MTSGARDVSVPATPFATYSTTPGLVRTERQPLRHQTLRDRLDCRFDAVDDVFDDCLDEAQRKLSAPGLDAYLEHAKELGKLGRGVEPLLVFLEIWPTVAGWPQQVCCSGTSTRHPAASNNVIAAKPIEGRMASTRQVTNSPTRGAPADSR